MKGAFVTNWRMRELYRPVYFTAIAHDLTNILQSNVIFKEIDETFIEMHFEKKVSLNIMKINIEITDHIQEFSRRKK